MTDLIELIGLQRAEFEIAATLFRKRFAAQVALAALGAGSAAIADNKIVYWLAICSFGLFLLWVRYEIKYRAARANAERARRATLIMGGLGKPISHTELHQIKESMSASEKSAARLADPDYYASMSAVGPQRLAEMLEEAAYWTSNLQKISETVMSGAFVAVLLVAGASFLALIPAATPDNAMMITRIFLSVLVFSVGSDMLLTAISYRETHKVLEKIMYRIDAAKARGYPETDLLMLLCDYNAAVEATPLSLPFAYNLRKAQLNRNWAARRSAA